MIPDLFLRDLESKPVWLRALAERLATTEWPVRPGQRLLLTGMGSSWFAADVAARRFRRVGVHAVADLASVEASLPPQADLAVVGISASGGSTETLQMLTSHRGVSTTIALTNTEVDLPADHRLLMHAGPEDGGVACRSYLHTIVMLLQLEQQLTGSLPDLAPRVLAAADAVEHLLATRDEWLPRVEAVLNGPNGSWLLAPAERLGSALQGALMLREGPRVPADGCETGDWCHVDVYLTRSLDYRALLFAGSRFDASAAKWMRERGSRYVVVGQTSEAAAGAEVVIGFPHDHDPLVALLVEVLVPELLAAGWWIGR